MPVWGKRTVEAPPSELGAAAHLHLKEHTQTGAFCSPSNLTILGCYMKIYVFFS